MTGFEPRASGVKSNRFTNYATTTTRLRCLFHSQLARSVFFLSLYLSHYIYIRLILHQSFKTPPYSLAYAFSYELFLRYTSIHMFSMHNRTLYAQAFIHYTYTHSRPHTLSIWK